MGLAACLARLVMLMLISENALRSLSTSGSSATASTDCWRDVAAVVFPTDLDKTSFGTDAGNEATASDVSMSIACIPANFRSSLAVRDAAETKAPWEHDGLSCW